MSIPPILQAGGAFCVIRSDIAEKLIACGDGDSALLYLYFLRHAADFDNKKARRALSFTKERYERAMFTLTNLEFASENTTSPTSDASSKPVYSASELRQARSGDAHFSAVCQAAETVLGRTLTEAQLRCLFTVYDHLGLPADVIIELLSYLKRENGTVKRRDIEREACRWVDMGIATCEDAQRYLAKQEAEKPLIAEMQRALALEGRELNAQESRYLSDFIALGFPADAVALAAQRTTRKLGKFSWNYLSKILAAWDQKGIHTVEEITALEPEKRTDSAIPSEIPHPEELQEWEKEWLEEVDRRKKKRREEG